MKRRTRRRSRWIITCVLVLMYVAVMSFGGCADRLILQPPAGAIDAQGAHREVVKVNGRDVEVWTARAAALRDGQPQAYVLEFTGNATRAEQIAVFVAHRWGKYPVEAWVMNYPGYGGSHGKPRLNRIPEAALAVYDALRQRAGDKPIFVEANSLGTTSALYVAAQRPVAGCVLQNPVPLRQLILGRFGWWNLWLLAGPVAMQVPADLNSISNAKKVTAPAVFLLAARDALVCPRYQEHVTYAYRGPKRIIPLAGAGHNDGVSGDAERKLQQEIAWLWEARPATRPGIQ